MAEFRILDKNGKQTSIRSLVQWRLETDSPVDAVVAFEDLVEREVTTAKDGIADSGADSSASPQ